MELNGKASTTISARASRWIGSRRESEPSFWEKVTFGDPDTDHTLVYEVQLHIVKLSIRFPRTLLPP